MPIYFKPANYTLPLTIDSIGNHWKQEKVTRRKGFPLYHWIQTEKGCGKILIENCSYDMEPSMGILIAPGIPHEYYRVDECWYTSFATFSGSLISSLPEIIGENADHILVDKSKGGFFRYWIDEMIQQYESQQLSEIEFSTKCYAFFLQFSEVYHQETLVKHPLFRQYVTPTLQTIKTQYAQPLSVESLAASVFITSQYLSRLYNRFLGCSVSHYLNDFRINKAKELLCNNQETKIDMIAYQVGFQDTSYFISVFKKVTGYTPLNFRKLHR